MIWIRVVSRAGVPLGARDVATPLAARFGEAVGDIGRGVGCTLVLPDPDRQISRKQALITCLAGRHYIRPIGSNLDMALNGVRLAPDVETALDVGAELRIGPYLMRIEPAAEAEAPAPAPPLPRVAPQQAPRPAQTPPRAAPPPVARPPAAPAAERAPRQPAAAVPAAVQPSAARRADARGEAADEDPQRTRKEVPKGEAAALREMVDSLYAGLGAGPAVSAARSPQQARLVGELLRAAIGGTLELLAARMIAKRELGARATVLQTRGNNPLKFSPDADTALGHLLGPPMRGFIGPRAAMREAFADLRAHQVAVLAGMRAALQAVLTRFDPVELEARLAPKAMWDNLVPANRRAKLWEQYTERYAEILQEVEDDFDALFGRAFLQAYQAQLAQLAPEHDEQDESDAR
jgi:FHA domain-containing protein